MTYPHSFSDTAESARRTGNEFRDDLSQGARDIAASAGEQASRLREQARDWMHRGTSRAKDAVAYVRDEAQMVGDRTQQYVRDEPLKSVAIAAAAGAALAGLIMLLRSSRR